MKQKAIYKIVITVLAIGLLFALSACDNNQSQATEQTQKTEQGKDVEPGQGRDAIIATENEADHIGPYSQAVRGGGLLYCSMQLALDPETNDITGDDVTEQLQQIFENYDLLLETAGLTYDDVIKATVYLEDMDDFEAMNIEYAKHFKEPYPARACLGIDNLPVDGAIVGIEFICQDNQEI
jgi:2-iminobutanoate/2-iminopropanoate deaminase